MTQVNSPTPISGFKVHRTKGDKDQWLKSNPGYVQTEVILRHDGCSCLPSASKHALLAKDLVTWQAMVGRHILEDIVGRVVQYVDEHYPVDKWHLGDLIAWVAQSALNIVHVSASCQSALKDH
ncbi:hypothetical protein TNCV_1750191 [Trichonephila clavipes]|nr:hypothetical protein TNCV_1750191 [Trichonephila clavipes]